MHRARLPLCLQPFRCSNLVRIGKNHDGGYLVNELDIRRTQHLLSFGIGADYSFEQDFVDLAQCAVDSYDASVDGGDFFVGNRVHHRENITPNNLNLVGQNLFLKCDIEGAEYSLLDQLIWHSPNFTGMAFEFHDLNQSNNMDRLINFVSKTTLKLIHVHVNNYFYYINGDARIPDILELTFTGSSNIIYDGKLTLPHQLDMPNNPKDQEFYISFNHDQTSNQP